jgi:hypothetical protein
VNGSRSSARAGPDLLRRPVTSIGAFMRMVVSGGVRVGARAEAASLACGGTGLAGIGQLADIAIGPGRATGAEIGALPDRPAGQAAWAYRAGVPAVAGAARTVWCRRRAAACVRLGWRPGRSPSPAGYPRCRIASAASWVREVM